MLYRIIVIIIIISRLLTASGGAGSETHDADISARLRASLEFIRESAVEMKDTSSISEWTVIALAVGGSDDRELYDAYLDAVTKRVAAEVPGKTPLGTLSEHKATENARVVLALSAIGADPTNIGGYDLTAPLTDTAWVCSGTVNGPIFALIALDASGVEDGGAMDRLADYILERQLPDGGWALSSKKADVDVTAMALQALAACADRPDVTSAAERAVTVLSELQQENGGYRSFGRENSESISQVIIALSDWGISPDTDERFIKNGKSLLDALMDFSASDGGFLDVLDSESFNNKSSQMATEQASLALAALVRNGESGVTLYSFGEKKAR